MMNIANPRRDLAIRNIFVTNTPFLKYFYCVTEMVTIT